MSGLKLSGKLQTAAGALMLAFLLMFLTACGANYLPIKPNPSLTRDCDYPVLDGETYRDALILVERRGDSLKECSGRMRAIRE